MDDLHKNFKQNKLISSTAEYVSPDILEDDFVKCFAPFHYLQEILGTSRVRIKDRFVTEPDLYRKIYSILCIFGFGIAAAIHIKTLFLDRFDTFLFYYAIGLVGLFVYFAQYTTNMIYSRFINNQQNVQLYIKLQQLDRKLKISADNPLNETLTIRHRIQVLFAIVSIATTLIKVDGTWTVTDIFRILSVSSGVAFYTEITFFYHLVGFVKFRLRYFNEMLRTRERSMERDREELGFLDRFFFISEKRIREIVSARRSLLSAEESVAFVEDILECYYMILRLYKVQVLLFSAAYVYFVFLIVQSIIMSIKYKMLTYNDYYDMSCLLLVNMISACVMSVSCHTFRGEVYITRHICIHLLSLHQQGSSWWKSKRILGVIDGADLEYTIYDVFVLDGHLPLKFFAFTMTYTIVLLQFAFL